MNLQDARKKLPELNGLSDESALNVIHEVYYPSMDKAELASRLGYKAPEVPIEIKNPGFFRGMADTGLALGQGVAGAFQSMSNLVGADNAVSRGLEDASKGLETLKSNESQQARQQHLQAIKAAEESGDTGAEIAAYANMVWDMPAESIAQGVGSFATLGVGKAAQALNLVRAAKAAGMSKEAFLATEAGAKALTRAQDIGFKTNVGMGMVQGMGAVKGSQFEQTYQNAIAQGQSPEQAQALAAEAQAYGGPGTTQQVLGAGLGYLAGKTGPIEKLVAGKGVGAGGLMQRTVGGFATEGLTEGSQGAQERFAGNTAAIDAGVLDPSKRFTGVAGQGVSDGMVGGLLGGGAGALGGSAQEPGLPSLPTPDQEAPGDTAAKAVIDAKLVPETGPMTRAANVATLAEAEKVRQEVNAAAVAPTQENQSPVIGTTNVMVDGKSSTKISRRDGSVEIDGVQVVPPTANNIAAGADQLPGAGNMVPGADQETGEIAPPPAGPEPLDLASKTDEELTIARQSAQDPAIRKALAMELQARRAAAEPAAPAAPVADKPATLPTNLAGAKEGYNYGKKAFNLTFDNDIDRAAYITALTKPDGKRSAKDDDYLKFAMDATGMTEVEVRAHGQKVKDGIKAQAKGAEPGKLAVPGLYAPKAVPAVPAGNAGNAAAKPADGPLIDEGAKPNVTLTNEGRAPSGNIPSRQTALKGEYTKLKSRLDEDGKSAGDDPLGQALSAIFNPLESNDKDSQLHALNYGEQNNRPDIAAEAKANLEKLADKLEQDVKSQSTKPGVPESSPKYQKIKTDLEARKAKKSSDSAEIRGRLAGNQPATKSPIEQMRDDVDAQLQEPKGQFATAEAPVTQPAPSGGASEAGAGVSLPTLAAPTPVAEATPANTPETRWAQATPAERVEIAQAGGIELVAARNVARKDWSQQPAKVQEKLAKGLGKPESAPAVSALADVSTNPQKVDTSGERVTKTEKNEQVGFTDLEKALQAQSRDTEADGDVAIVAGGGQIRYVSLGDAAQTVQQAIDAGVQPVPFQIHNATGIRIGDVDGVLKRLKERAPAEQPPASQPKTSAQPSQFTPVGKNEDGKDLVQDARGVRSYVTNGIRITEPLRMSPKRDGVEIEVGNRRDEFKTTGELGAERPPAAQTAEKPATVEVPADISDAMGGQMQKQKNRVARLMREAQGDMSLDEKTAAQTKVKAAEATLRKMRTSIFDAEDAAIKAVDSGNPADFAEHADLFSDAAALIAGRAKPAPVEQPAAPAKPAASANTIFTEDAAAAARARLKAKLGRLNSGIDPEMLMDGITLAGYHIEKGARTFAAYAKAMVSDLGDGVKPYLKSWYMGVKYDPRAGAFDGMDGAAAVEAADVDAMTAAQKVQAKTLTESLYQAIRANQMPKDNPALKKLVEAFDGKPADQARMKQAQEELETAIAMMARELVAKNEGDRTTFDMLLRLYESQPNLNIRTSTSIANQAYSTPAPLAYLASRLAGVTKSTVAHEPTGGTGMLMIGADPKKAIVNELNDLRIEALKAQGFAPTQKDAATQMLVPEGTQPDALLTNPPFGSIKDAEGKPVKVKVDGFSLGQIDHLIAARALNTLKDDGRATLILGANKMAGGLSTDDRIFFNWLYSHYNVVGHFEVEGDLYARQGAGWPVRVITINGRQKSDKFSPVAGTIQRADNWDSVYEQFTQSLAAARAAPATDGARKPASGSAATPTPADTSRPTGGARRDGNVAGTSARDLPDSAGSVSERVGGGSDEQRLNAQSYVPQPQPGQDPVGAARPEKPAGTAGVNEAQGNEFQAPYIPRSARKDEGVLIPANMAQPTQDALSRLEDEVGDIDEYARNELGYATVEDLHNALMGLQVDSVATSIYQIKQGKAVVIADQTGIGKGRQAASIIRWAARQGMTPVFVSVSPGLFTDMYGDLADIGTSDVTPFIMNSDAWVAGDGGTKLFSNKPGTHKRVIQEIANSGKLPAGSNALFMTYSQITVANVQRQALMALAPNAVFVLDESHNAAGASSTGDFVIGALEAAKGVVYLSATYAKRPDNMPLYFKTDIGEAAADTEGLAVAMASGGLPLQTVVSNNLVKAGQMFRRERSYDGVSIASVFDSPNRALHERMSNGATKALRAIVSADRMFHEVYVKQLAEQLAESGATVQDNAGNQIEKGVQHTEFSSVVHNFVKQMLLGLKAQSAADEAIASLKRGEKPIIAVENTMGSFLSEYAASNGISQGDSLGTFDYRTVLTRALARSRVVTEVAPNGDKVPRPVSMSQLDARTQAAYNDAQAVIDGLVLNIPVSPIDWMRAEITRAGFKVAEITGRNLSVDYGDPKKPILSALDATEQKDKVSTTRQFNSGNLDALILNKSGSTGISLHASEKFEDQRQRHMIVAQAAGDINIFMQMLGRVHRTGQVRLPKYTILSVDLPTEKRPTAVLSIKMKSLNANTSSNTESATSVKSSDILNKYGDQIVNQYLRDNYALARALDLEQEIGDDPAEDIARKAAGRLALQPIATQHAFYDEVEAQYTALIDYLNKTNQNDLDPRTFDFDAKETRQEVLFDGPNKNTPFGEDAIYGEYSIKAQGTPMKPEEIRATMAENLGDLPPAAHAQKMLDDLDAKYQAFYATLDDGSKEAAASVRNIGRSFLSSHKIGATFRVDINSEPFNAVVLNVRNTHKETGNPYSMSKIQVSVAVNGALRSLSVPATQFSKIEVSGIAPTFRIEQLFKEQPPNQRETAKIITGNLLAAYGEIQGARGTIITFTKQDGTSEQGILLPKLFDYSKNTRGDYRLADGAAALKFLQQSEDKDIGRFGIMSRDGNVRVLPAGQGIRVQVPKSKLKGAKYFLDKGLIEAGGDFVTQGNFMVSSVDAPADAVKMLDLLMKKQALYALPSMAEEAKALTGDKGASATDDDAADPAMFSRSPMKSVDANVRRGQLALAKALDEKTTVHRAMFRNGLGWVDFVWGAEGVVKASGKTKGAMGLSHIIEARQRKDALSDREVLTLLEGIVDAIASGAEISRSELESATRVGLEKGGTVVWLTKQKGSNAWIVTAYEKNPDGANAGRATYAPTSPAASLTRDQRVAEFGKSIGSDGSDVNMSRGAAATGVTQEVAQDVIDAITARWANAPEVVVVQDMTDPRIPEAVRTEDAKQRSQGSSGEPEGFWHDGKAYVVAGALRSPGEVMRVLFHETLGHYGLRGTFGDKLKPILMQLANLRRGEIVAKAREYGLVRKGPDSKPSVNVKTATDAQIWAAMDESHKLEAAEEVLAVMAQSKPEIGYVKKVIALIRGFLRENVPGFQGMKMTDADIIANFILPARAFVERGAGRGGRMAPAFSRGAMADQAQQLRELAASARTGGNENKTVVLRPVSAQEADFLQGEGVAVDEGFAHTADMFAVRHALNRHGDGKAEAKQGQLPIKDDDIAAIPQIVGAADALLLGAKTPRGQDIVGSLKRLPDGTVLYLEEVRSGRKTLAMTSMRKYPGTTDFETIKNRVVPSYAQSDTGDVRIVYPNGGDGQEGDAAMFSRTLSAPELASSMRDKLNETFNHPGKLSWWHKTVGSQYNLAERNPAFKKVFDAAQSFINDVSYYGTEAANMAPKILPKLETLKDLTKSAISAADNKAVAAPIFQGTLSWTRDANGKPVRLMEGDDRKPGIRWTAAELKAQFKLTDEQIGLYNEFRAATDASLDNVAKAQMLREAGKDVADMRDMVMDAPDADTAAKILRQVLQDMARDNPDRADAMAESVQSVNALAEKVGKLKQEGYAPLSRFGKFTVDAVVDGKREYFGMFETERAANRMAATLRMEFGRDNVSQGTMSQKEYELFQGITPESLELFGNMMGLDSTGNEAQDKAFQTYLKLTKNNRSAMKRMIHRQGIAGYSEDVGRVLAAFVYANARQTSAALHIGQMDEAINAIPKGEGELKDHALELATYIKEPREEAAALRGLLFAQYLGGSVASAMINFTQPLTVSIPYLSQFGGLAKAGKAWAQAVKDMSRGAKLEAGLERALKDAEESGVVSPQEIHQLMAQARGAATLESGDGTRQGDAAAMAKNTWTRTTLAWGKLFGYAEQVNRRSTFIAAYRMAAEQGIANPGAFATKAVNETQFINNKANKMKFGRGAIGATLMTFKSYSLNWLELMHRLSTQDGKEGKLAAAYMLGALFLVAGAGGLPFGEDLEDLIDAIAQKAGYNFSSKKQKQQFLEDLFGKSGAAFVERGLTGIPGVPIDVSGRMGMQNLLPGTGLLLEKRDSTRDAAEILGPVGDLVKRLFQAVGALASGEVGQAVKFAAPTAVTNAIKGADMADKGMYRDTKGAKVIDTTAAEAMAKMIGFQPATVSKVQESNFINQRAKDFYSLKTQEIRAKWAMGIFENDPAKIAEARQDIADWNANNPDQRMQANMPAIIKKVREMRKDKAQRIADTAPKAMRAQMRADARELAGQ